MVRVRRSFSPLFLCLDYDFIFKMMDWILFRFDFASEFTIMAPFPPWMYISIGFPRDGSMEFQEIPLRNKKNALIAFFITIFVSVRHHVYFFFFSLPNFFSDWQQKRRLETFFGWLTFCSRFATGVLSVTFVRNWKWDKNRKTHSLIATRFDIIVFCFVSIFFIWTCDLRHAKINFFILISLWFVIYIQIQEQWSTNSISFTVQFYIL